MDKYIRHFKAWQRLGIILANLSIFFNSFLPLAYLLPQSSFAIDEQPTPVPTQAPLEVSNEAPTPTEVINNEPVELPTESPVEVPTETPVETPTPTGVDAVDTPAPTQTPVEPVNAEPAEAPTPEPTNAEPSQSSIETPTPTGVDAVDTPAPTPTTIPTVAPVSVVEQICLNPATVITDSADSAWSITNDSSVTIDNVQLGVRYTFPHEKKVSVTFTCLPLDPSLRSKLTIEQVKVADLNLPDSVSPATEYAYDITTDMAGGLFKYDVTLPKVNDTIAEVSYISKTIDQVKNSAVTADEIKSVDSADITQQTETVQAADLNHFTIFIATYSTSSFSTTKTIYTQGETVYANSTGLTQNNGIYYRIDIINPSGVSVANSSCSKNISSLSYSYPTTISDPLGTTWKAEITQYGSNSDCNSKTNKTDTGTAVFELQAPVPTSTPIPTTTPIISPVTTVSSSCMGVLDSQLTCTANDVSLANVTGITILDDGCQFPGDDVTFKATWDVQSNANRRYDIGLWFATGGQSSALYGSCSASSLPNSPIPPWFDYDQDACGDIESSSIVNPEITLTVKCLDSDSNNALNLPYCTSWQQNAGNVCNGPSDTLPGAPSKCNCEDGFQIPINVPYGAKIEVVKNLVPSTDAGRFNLQIGSSTMASNVGNNGTTGQVTVGAGTSASPGATHTVGETAYTGTNLSDYQSSISCVKRGTATVVASSTNSGPLSVPVQKNDDILCTITNSLNLSTLTIEKTVVNNNGGLATESSFNVYVGTSQVAWDTSLSLIPSTYTVSESTLPGYSASVWGGDCAANGSVTLLPGNNKTCTITNDDQPATLIVKKVVVNDNGGLKAASDFTFSVNTATAVAFEADGQNDLTVNAGTYSITEPTVAGYSTTYDNCSNLVIPNGGTATCTITNDDIAPVLTFTKLVNNSYGGTLVAADFPLFIDSNTVTSGTPNTLLANRVYTLSETQQIGYTGGYFTGDCNAVGSISLAVGDNKTCTITNYDVQPKLTVTKVVINDDGGTQVVTDFPLFINTTSVKSGVQTGLNAGTYTVSETNQVGYTSVISGDCDANGSVTLSTGDNKTCTITNDDVAPKLTLVKTVTNDNGGNKVVSDFKLYINGTAATSGTTYPQLANTLLTATEDSLTGYSASTWGGDCATDGTITLAPGDNKTCTITNDDQPATLIVKKVVVNDNGGLKAASDFTFSVNTATAVAFEADGQNDLTVNAGTYSITEPTVAGYSTTYDNCTGVVIPNGGTATCTITNDDKPGSITITKNAVPNAGRDFDFTSSNIAIPSFSLDDDTNNTLPNTRTFSGLSAGGYVITEGADTRWDLTNIVCVDPDNGTTRNVNNRRATIDLDLGEDITCTFTNRRRPLLTVIKHVINDNGGTALAGEFTMNVTGVNPSTTSFAGSESGTLVILNPGEYEVDETDFTGYSKSLSEACSGTLAYGNQKTCTITNDDVAPKLTLVKTVTNDNGGNKVVSDFNLYINGTAATSGTTYPQLANTLLTATEDTLTGYTASVWGGDCATDGTITLAPGDNKTCTITNDDVAPTLKLTKIVINDNGGDAQDSEWNLSATGTSNSFTESGDSVTFHQVTAGVSYELSESGPTGYTFSDWVCDGGTLVESAITLNLDQDVTCTITNNDIAPKLTVVKTVVNDNEGTKTVSDFNLYSNATPIVSGVTNDVMANTLYTLTEDNLPGYTASVWGGDCATDGTITLYPGEEKTCTITNDDTFGKVIVTKFNDKNNNGIYDEGDEVLPDWKIKLTGNGTQDTDDAGQAIFSPVIPGAYGLSEIMQTGWQQTAIYCEDDEPTPTPTGPTSTPTTTTTPSPTATPTPTTGGGICHWNEGADKWNALSVNLDNPGHVGHSQDFEYDGPRDSKGNPAKDAHNKDDPTKNGDAWCDQNNRNLSFIDQILGVKPAYAVTQENDDYQINLEASQTLRCYVGNKFVQPKLNISKFNNRWPNSQSIGSEVTYTIKVKAIENDVQGITVTDLPPLGFIYKTGSYHVEVDGSPITITEPQYNSPGKWFIGNLAAGQEAVLTYIATISSSVDPGLYKDLAWAFGCTDSTDCQFTSTDKLLATSIDSGHIDPGVLSTTFVGTKINLSPILADTDINIENKVEGQVLGVSSLPATGANPLWIFISLFSITSGLVLLKKSKKI